VSASLARPLLLYRGKLPVFYGALNLRIGLIMKKTALILGLLFSTSSFASIECHTPRMNKTFKIEDNRVTFFNDQPVEGGREVASVGTRTRKTATGFTKVLSFEGRKHTIHIDNAKSFSDVNDYMVVRNNRGHEMTYPLTCK